MITAITAIPLSHFTQSRSHNHGENTKPNCQQTDAARNKSVGVLEKYTTDPTRNRKQTTCYIRSYSANPALPSRLRDCYQSPLQIKTRTLAATKIAYQCSNRF